MSELSDKLNDREAGIYFMSSQNDFKPTMAIHDFRKKDKLTLALIGDQHIGSKYHNEEFHDEIINWCYEKEIPIILMGDQLETATKNSVGAGVYEQTQILEQQIETFLIKYKPLAEKKLILGIHPGNHEYRVYKDCGLDITKLLAKDLNTKYLGWGKLHYFKVGKENYTLYTTHGASGARLPHTKIKAAIDLSNMIDADIYAMGHTHQLSNHVRTFYKADKRSKKITQSQKHFLLTGSFLNHWGSYGHMKNYEPMRLGSPKLKLSGEKKQVRVSLG